MVKHAIVIQVSARIFEQMSDGGYSPDAKHMDSKIVVLEAKNLTEAKKLLNKKIEELKNE